MASKEKREKGKTVSPKKRAEIEEIKKRREEIKKAFTTVGKIMPIVGFNEELKVFNMADGKVMDFFGIVSKDLYGISEDDRTFDILSFDKLFKTYADSLKIICFNFPTDTREQQSYIEKVIKRTENPLFKEQLEERIAELEYLNLNKTQREFIICFFANSTEDYKNKYLSIKQSLSSQNMPLVKILEEKKKKEILYKLYNKNSLPEMI